ncbi:transposable element Tc1 transposase [Trichonephila clavipes]|nr:transposable element Tc1 transposase [Trichonephila clavipes]
MIAFIRALKVLTRVDSCCFKSKFYRKDLIDELKIFGMSSRHHIDDFMRGRIIGKIEEGRKITDVAKEFDIAHSVVSRLWKSFKTTGMCSRRHGGGRVISTTPAEDRYIVLSAKRNRRITDQQVANQFLAASGKQISRKTVARRLRGGGLYARRPVVCVPLTRQHRTARLQWCREHHNWTEQDWACVLFSDESRFSLSSDCRRQLIWRESGTAYRPENIQEKDRYPTCSIMVWAGIMINGRTRLHVVANGTMTGQRYIDEVLLPHVRLFRGAVGDKFVFMDDNATCHRTLAVQDCLDSEGIQRLVWPARSPDLNPIENVWDALGRQVAGRNYPPTNKNTLIRALTEEWDKLLQQLLDNVVQTVEEYVLGDTKITVEKGTRANIPVYAMHYDPDFFEVGYLNHLPKLFLIVTRRVAGQVDRSECAIRNCWEQWTREGTHARKTGSGATRKTTRREDRRIMRQALVDPTVTRSTIRADVGVAIVPKTISRHLAEANLKSKRPFRALPLTPEHRQLRLQWCQTKSMWNVTDWQKVVFSDESRFVLGTDDKRVRVCRCPGERYNSPHTVLRHTARTADVMVCGALAYGSRSTLIVMRGTLTGQRYVDDILRPHVGTFLNGLPGAIFQQDNARPHTERVTQDFLRHFQTLPWPARTPDSSPVEHVWYQLKRQMAPCHSVHNLELAVQDLWAQLSQDNIRCLINSMMDRVAACIAAGDSFPLLPTSLQKLIYYFNVNKQADLPAYLKQLALERIGDIPIDAVQNPEGCSVFRNELIAIDEALGSLAFLPNGKKIWILSDSGSAIQHLSSWQSVRDNVGVLILIKLKRLSTSHQIHLQWIPSHIDLEGNEIADTLAKAGSRELPEPSAPFTSFCRFSLELNTRIRPLGLPPGPRAPLVSMFSFWRLSGLRFYKTGSNSSSALSKWAYQINEIF